MGAGRAAESVVPFVDISDDRNAIAHLARRRRRCRRPSRSPPRRSQVDIVRRVRRGARRMGEIPGRGRRESPPSVVGCDGCLVHGLERHRRVVRGLCLLTSVLCTNYLCTIHLLCVIFILFCVVSLPCVIRTVNININAGLSCRRAGLNPTRIEIDDLPDQNPGLDSWPSE